MVWFTWRAIVEILFFSSLFYACFRWLRKDARLLTSFSIYWVALLGAQLLELQTIAHALMVFAPAAVMLCIVLHQDTLAKRYVTVRNVTTVQPTTDWLATLFGVLLSSVQKNRPAFVVIEKHDQLRSLLASANTIHADIQKNLLELLVSSQLYDANKLIWLNHRGELLAINAYWHPTLEGQWISEEVLSLEVWKQDGLLLAHKTDAIVFYIKPETRTVTLISQKKMIEDVSVSQAMLMVKQYLYSTTTPQEQTTILPTRNHQTQAQR